MNNVTSALFHLNHSTYRCHPAPPHLPLTLPVKFVVPPKTDGILSDPTRQFCFEDSSADESTNKFTNNKHSKNICIDNYSRIILEDDKSTRYVSEFFQDVYLNSLPRKFSADSHQSTDIDDKYTNIFAGKQPRKHSLDKLPKLYKTDDKSNMLSDGEQHRKFSPKDMLVKQQLADEISKKAQRNIKRFLVDPTASLAHDKQSCEGKEPKSVIPCDLESNPSKMKTTSPLDLTKLK